MNVVILLEMLIQRFRYSVEFFFSLSLFLLFLTDLNVLSFHVAMPKLHFHASHTQT